MRSFSLRLACTAVAGTLFLGILASCAPPSRPPEPKDLFWPLPPDQPRIQYLRSIYTEDDIGRVYSFWEKLFGKEYDDSLYRPYGVFARQDRLLVSDLVSRRVAIFDLEQRTMKSAAWDGTAKTPAGIVSDSQGTIYVADAGSDRVLLYNSKGDYLSALIIPGSKPVAVALNEKRGRIYVVDRRNHQVVVLDLKGQELFRFGGQGSMKGQFNMPIDIALSSRGDLYVLDSGNFSVQRFDPEGVFLSRFGGVGDRPGKLSNAKGIALDSADHVYVTDAAYNNFQIFDSEGNILLAVGSLGVTPGRFYLPAGIYIDEHDRIYVADQLNGRVQVFQYLK